ncbi:HNH endonuclease [Microbacterium marinum]|uniref:HNH endonuclease signature motif containing protein n=1 Tax=Microbacterium marinum TaxID=421115 RepID=UPI00384F2D55
MSDAMWPALDALVGEVVDTRRRIAELQATEARLLAGSLDLLTSRVDAERAEGRTFGSDLPLREISLEFGAAMRLSDRAVQARIGEAAALVERFPAIREAWSAGEIDAGHVWPIVRAGSMIADDENRARYEGLVLRAAETESAGRMPSIAKAIAAAVDPDAFAAQVAREGDDRSVRVYGLDAGMARLIADLPAPLAYAIFDRLTEQAVVIRGEDSIEPVPAERGPMPADQERVITRGGRKSGAGDDPDRDLRTTDQIRADLFCDLLLTGAPAAASDGVAAVRGNVQITIPATTLLGGTGGPALLAGYGPIDPALARRLAGLAPGWDRIFTDPYTGEPLAVDRYRPSAAIRRFLVARDERCRAPGCTRAARRCDIDHTRAASEGGSTDVENLADFCRRHHICKHHTCWRVRQLGRGDLEWTGPSGRRYVDRPPAVVRFVPEVPVKTTMAHDRASVEVPPF